MNNRKKPYSEGGIHRVPCVKCGKPSRYQFRICSTDRWTAVCPDCDLYINRIVACWAYGKKQGNEIVDAYEQTRDT